MSKFAIAGVLSLIAAAMTFGYQAISSVMGPKASYITYRPVDILGEDIIALVDGISSDILFKITDYLITTPIYLIFLVVGVLLLLISSLLWRN